MFTVALFRLQCRLTRRLFWNIGWMEFTVYFIMCHLYSFFFIFYFFFHSLLSAVCCVFSIKWTWKGIRFIIYGILLHKSLSLPWLKNSQWHVTLILLTFFLPSVCNFTFSASSSLLTSIFRIKFICVAILIYGTVFNSPQREEDEFFLTEDFLLWISSPVESDFFFIRLQSLISIWANNFSIES